MSKNLIYFILIIIWSCSPKRANEVTQPFTPSPLSHEEISPFLQELMSKMTLEEKIGQLNLLTPGGAVTGSVVSKNVEEKLANGQVGGIFGIKGAAKVRQLQELAVDKSRLGIPLIIGMDVIHGHQTIYPIPLGLSCSWNMDLIQESARISAREATADGIMWTFSPMVDIARDPRWGRIAEGAGEDPYLGSRIAEAMVKGYQGKDLADPVTMLACVKHLALYGAAEGGRDYATVDMSKIRMYNEYFPPYKAAIDAGVGSIMTSFNTVDYIPASGSSFLFKQVLREKWGFEGMVVTDYTSINEMMDHGLGDLQEVSALALKAGIDMDMVGEGFIGTLAKSHAEGLITTEEIENACLNVLKAKENLGLFDDPYRYIDEDRAKREILSSENRAFAKAAARESFVLLKNDNQILPLEKDVKLAIVGPLADSRRNMLGTWSVSGDHAKAATVLEGFMEYVAESALISYAKGCNISDDAEFAQKVNAFGPEIVIDERSAETMIREALQAAESSDVIIAVMGEAADMSGEASSMAHIGLQPSQRKLLEALKSTGKPIVMLLFNGRPMTLTWENENMDAILDVWSVGTEGAHAIPEIIYGAYNPSGRLTTSFPVHVGQIPVYHAMLPSGRPYEEGTRPKFRSNYLDIPNAPLYPFGYGLSYSEVLYSPIEISRDSILLGDPLIASVSITNESQMEVKETVQLYVRDMVASISRPLKELKGFRQITLQPGESKNVHFDITTDLLSFYDEKYNSKVETGDFRVFIGPHSATKEFATFHLRIAQSH